MIQTPTPPVSPATIATVSTAITALKTNTFLGQKVLSPEDLAAGLLTLPTLAETQIDETDHVIIYGSSGTGKTTAAGLLSEFYNLLWFDGDKGLTALKHNLHPEMLKRIVPIKILDNTSTPNMVNTMLRVVTGRQVSICLGHGIVDCPMCKQEGKPSAIVAIGKLPKNWVVVMDSHTQFYASACVIAQSKIAGKALADTDDGFHGNFDFWAIVRNAVDKFGNYVKDLPCKFVDISHETLTETEDKMMKKLVPIGGSENASRNYAKYFGTEINSKIVNGKIVFYSGATASAGIQTKSRSNVALELKATPSLLHVFNATEADKLLKGSYNEWYYKEGWLPKEKRTKPMPQPKGILSNGTHSE